MSRIVGLAACAAALLAVASPCLAFEYVPTPTNADGSPRLVDSSSAKNFSSTTTDAYGRTNTTTKFGNATVTFSSGSYNGYGNGYSSTSSPYTGYRGGFAPTDPRAAAISTFASPADRSDRSWPFGDR